MNPSILGRGLLVGIFLMAVIIPKVGNAQVTNLGLEGSSSRVSGNLVAFAVRESSQGNTDLNGDSDANDSVVHIYDATTGITTNLELAGGVGAASGNGNLVAFAVSYRWISSPNAIKRRFN